MNFPEARPQGVSLELLLQQRLQGVLFPLKKMFDYLKKFNNLDPALKAKVSSAQAMDAIDLLEKEYGIDLASVVMKVMIKEIPYDNLSLYFSEKHNLSEEKAKELFNRLKEQVFIDVLDYLNSPNIEKTTNEEKSDSFNDDENNLEEDEEDEEDFYLDEEDLDNSKNLNIPFKKDENNINDKSTNDGIAIPTKINLSKKTDVSKNLKSDIKINKSQNLKKDSINNLVDNFEMGSKSNNSKNNQNLKSSVLQNPQIASSGVSDINKKIKSTINQNAELSKKRVATFNPPSSTPKGIITTASGQDLRSKLEPISNTSGSNLSFSPEDDEEIKDINSKMGDLGIDNVSVNNFSGKIEGNIKNIIRDSKIKFSTKVLEEKFIKIMTMYLRGVRNRIDTREVLMKPTIDGGLEFDVGIIDRVLLIAGRYIDNSKEKKDVISNQKKELDDNKINLSEKMANLSNNMDRDVEYNFSNKSDNSENINKNQDDSLSKHEEKVLNKVREDLISLSKKEQEREIKPNVSLKENNLIQKQNGSVQKDNFDNSVNLNQQQENNNFIKSNAPISGKKMMEDVKFVPRTMGPIEELRFMTLSVFRRLSLEPEQRSKTILTKIKMLEEENYKQKMQAIKAWRESPVNRLYLDMGAHSISEGKSIQMIIDERKNSDLEYLEENEFNSILELNKELRYS